MIEMIAMIAMIAMISIISRPRASRLARAMVLSLVLPLFATSSLGAERSARKPKLDWELSTGESLAQAVVEDVGGRPYVFAAIKEGGLLVLDTSAAGEPIEIARIPSSALRRRQAMNLQQEGTRIYVALGSFFSPKKVKAGLAVVDVSEPATPEVISLWRSRRKLSGSAMVLVDRGSAYLAAMDHGVFIFDVAEGGELEHLSTILPDVDFPIVNPNPVQHPNARGLTVRENVLYVAYDAGGLRIVDVSDRVNPVEIGRYLNPSMPNKPSAYNNVVVDWPYAYIAVDYCGLEIVDVSDPAAMRQVGWWNPWGCEKLSNLWFNSPGHSNQIAFDPDEERVYLSAGDSELRVIDVSDPARPRLATRFGKPQNGLGAWGVGLSADSIYLAYIHALIPFRGTWSGIKALRRRK